MRLLLKPIERTDYLLGQLTTVVNKSQNRKIIRHATETTFQIESTRKPPNNEE